jgi:hypothetical protein
MKLTADTLSSVPIILLYGADGTGKTRFLLTAPGPIDIHGFDRRPEKFWAPFMSKGVDYEHYVTYKQEHPHRGQDEKAMVAKIIRTNSETLEGYFQNLEASLKKPRVATVCTDNLTKVYAMNKFANFGRVEKIEPYHYGGLRATYSRIFDLAAAYNKVFLCTSEENELYRANKGTGRMKPDGDKTFLHGVNIILRMTRERDGFKAEFMKCSFNHHLVGETLYNDDINYDTVYELALE